jgi:hypothetical protein
MLRYIVICITSILQKHVMVGFVGGTPPHLCLAELLHDANLVTRCLLQRLLSLIKLGLQQQQQQQQQQAGADVSTNLA